jgi:Phasin protein
MPYRSQGGRAVNGNTGQSPTILFGPAPTFHIWGPLIAGALKANAQAQEAFGMIAGEWQAFVGHRLQEDMALMQRLAESRTPQQILAAHSAFWQKAAEDYGKEFTTISKLMAKETTRVAQASQAASDEVSRDRWHWQKVAV